ncbi:Gfo/Idh/MocA family protein [Bacillus timonensis]|uniref:Gfo/Idh/MocA family protein n=1 Tax=Bacillus timonensis TaxID=1033734 RepID=UPI000289882D|nr:Gfo/Idh/MocA family oxidoreductase [Bacillus timonensis]
MKAVKWGIMSTANIALTQIIPAINRASNATVLAIASRSEEMAQNIAREYEIPKFYNRYEDLLADPEIDAVYIPLPNHIHKKWAILAAKAGKHILCEKPIALNVKEVEEIEKSCSKNKVFFMEAFMYQFHQQHKRVKDILKNGELGTIKLMRASFTYNMTDRKTNIRMKKGMGGGAIYDIGCYCIHSIRTMLNAEPVSVQTFAEIDSKSGVDVSAIVHMKLNNNVDALFDCGFNMTFRNEYEIVGSEGVLKVPRAFRPDTENGEGLLIIEKGDEVRTERIIGDQYLNQIEYFSNCVINRTAPEYTLRNSSKNMKVIDAIYESIRKNEEIVLNKHLLVC